MRHMHEAHEALRDQNEQRESTRDMRHMRHFDIEIRNGRVRYIRRCMIKTAHEAHETLRDRNITTGGRVWSDRQDRNHTEHVKDVFVSTIVVFLRSNFPRSRLILRFRAFHWHS